MDNWIMLMEHYPSGEEIKLEGLQDENSKVGYGVSEIVSIGKVKCVEVKAPEYIKVEESKTFTHSLVEKVKKYKWVIINSVGLVLGGLGAKKLYDDYMINNYYVDLTYIRDHKISLVEIRIIERMDRYLQEEVKKGNIEGYDMNEDSKYFIYAKTETGVKDFYKVMPIDYRGRIKNELEDLYKHGLELDETFMSSVVPKIVVENQRKINVIEYMHLEKCLLRNRAKNTVVSDIEKNI